MTVIDTTNDARIETMYANPSGVNKRPSTPESANSGRNERMTTAVPKTIELRISLLASKTMTMEDCRLSIGWALFCFKRRKMFSTSTIASSTNSPMATAIPPRVMTLIDSSLPLRIPTRRKTSVVNTSDSGMAVSVMNVVRKFSRNRNKTMMTSTAPITSASATLKIPRSMKFFNRNSSLLTMMSAGSDASTSANAAATSSVSFRVSTCGCLTVVNTIPGRPLTLPSPRFS